jgi:hypothetical protein
MGKLCGETIQTLRHGLSAAVFVPLHGFSRRRNSPTSKNVACGYTKKALGKRALAVTKKPPQP